MQAAGSALGHTCRASVITAPSMQPPLTDPATSMRPPTIMAAPTGRGEDPQVSMTRARAKGRPSSSQARMSFQISLISFP